MALPSNNTLTNGSNTLLYTVPALKRAVVHVNLINSSGYSARMKIAVTTGGAPASADFIENAEISTDGILFRGGIPLTAGCCIYGFTNQSSCYAQVVGLERDA